MCFLGCGFSFTDLLTFSTSIAGDVVGLYRVVCGFGYVLFACALTRSTNGATALTNFGSKYTFLLVVTGRDDFGVGQRGLGGTL